MLKLNKLNYLVFLSLCAPALALADTVNVNIYGKLDADFEAVKNDKAKLATNASSLNRLISNSSYLGFKGDKDLGDGLKAIYQVDAPLNISTGTSGLGGTLRNSNLGMQGNFGTVFYGIWDTPYKVAHDKVKVFASSLSDLTKQKHLKNSPTKYAA